MTWLYYLLESNLYLAIFYSFYLIFLQKETFYGLNRGYLISSTIFSFLIPFLQIGILSQLIYGANKLSLAYTNPNLATVKSNELKFGSLVDLALVLYIVIAAYFIVKLIIGFYEILSLALKAKKETTGGITYIELKDSPSAFSFFNLLFINPSSKEKHTILKHEMVHIRQRHTVDILFFELLKIFNWFNPIVWLIQKDIKLLHEYIADDLTTNSDIEKHDYAMFLIQNSFGVTPNYLTNQIFNQSILKRRINMLNKRKSAGRARLKILLAVPIVGGMLLASTVGFSKDYAMLDLYPEKYSEGNPNHQSKNQKNRFPMRFHYDKATGKSTRLEKRLILLNGKVLKQDNIGLIENYDKMINLTQESARAKYGSIGQNGAIEFIGTEIKTLAIDPPPQTPRTPPKPPKEPKTNAKGTIKFPPPIVKKDQVKFPPPIVKKDEIIIPPPIVVKDGELPPPPPPGQKSRYGTNGKKRAIKFPPPIVEPDDKMAPPLPPVEPPLPASKKTEGTIK